MKVTEAAEKLCSRGFHGVSRFVTLIILKTGFKARPKLFLDLD